jgi:3-oxoadipate enol-lactonase
LCLSGQNDGALPACRFIHEKIQDSQLVVIPDAGHLSNLDQPVRFNAAVLEYLASIDQVRTASG